MTLDADEYELALVADRRPGRRPAARPTTQSSSSTSRSPRAARRGPGPRRGPGGAAGPQGRRSARHRPHRSRRFRCDRRARRLARHTWRGSTSRCSRRRPRSTPTVASATAETDGLRFGDRGPPERVGQPTPGCRWTASGVVRSSRACPPGTLRPGPRVDGRRRRRRCQLRRLGPIPHTGDLEQPPAVHHRDRHVVLARRAVQRDRGGLPIQTLDQRLGNRSTSTMTRRSVRATRQSRPFVHPCTR